MSNVLPKNLPKTLVIIPVFNEEKTVAQVATNAGSIHTNIDVLVINDKSTDGTESILQARGIKYITLPVNLGIGGAVQTGFKYANEYDYEFAIQVDGDGQHPARQIPFLLEQILNSDSDVVIGSRYINKNQIVSSWARRLGGGLLTAMIYLVTGQKITDPTSGFRAFSRKAIHFLRKFYPQEYPEPISIIELLGNGFKLQEIPIEMKEREHGESSISGITIYFYMIKVMFAIIIAKMRRG